MTQPNHHWIAGNGAAQSLQYAHGNDTISTALWPNGTIVFRPGGPGYVLEDGSLQMKFLWAKHRGGRVTISGHRVDDPSIPLRAVIDQQFDPADFQPSFLIFATPGCWEVTANAGGADLTFVTAVVKIGNGPNTSKFER